MAHNTMATNGQIQYGISEFVIDSPDDLQKLPKCLMGSIALCLSNSNVYVKDSTGKWVEI